MLKGVVLSIFASFCFGAIYYISTLMQPLSGQAVLGFRIVAIIPFIIFALILFKQQKAFVDLVRSFKQKPQLLLVLFITGLNTGFQMWLFMWAPNNNKGIDVSIGYLIMPIVMVIIGKFLYKEYLSRLKLLAIFSAVLGVAVNVILTQTISWEMLAVCLGYPLYFTLRKAFNLNSLAAFLVELLVLLPFCLYFICQANLEFAVLHNPNIYYFIGLLGLVSGVAFTVYIASSNLLPMNLLGMLSYLEPFCMLAVSFFIGETLDTRSYFLMICLTIAIGLLSLDGLAKLKKQKQSLPNEAAQ
ncbi:permease [Pasteurellaceae bacterium RH1A]|nr:permease [Pasteurellaceae bacterium RH1A]